MLLSSQLGAEVVIQDQVAALFPSSHNLLMKTLETLAPENQRILEFKLKWKYKVHISFLYLKLPGPMEN